MTAKTRTALGALAATALLTLTACGGGDDTSPDDKASTAGSSESADPDGAAPDVSDIPDVVAEVNGEEITKDEFVPIYQASFQQAATQAQATGEEPDADALRQQTLDDLVDTELLAQEADDRGIAVTDDDVDTELDDLAQQNGMESGDALLEAVAQQVMDQDTARAQVEVQVMVERLVADEDGPIEPTDKQLRALYAQAKKQQEQAGQDVPAFAKVRDQLVEQAVAQQTGQVAQRLVDGLRKDADITSNL